MRASVCILAAALALVATATARAQARVPPLEGRVNDRARLLSPEASAALETQLAALERETSHQIVVLTVPSLEGESIERFSLRVAEAWKIGQADLDNGVILVVARDDRRVRIEVGYGLEGAVPDAVAARIIRERIVPHLRAGRMDQGIEAGVAALAAAARGEGVPAARRPGAGSGGLEPSPLGRVLFCAFVGSLVGVGLGGRRRARRAAVGGLAAGILASILVGGVPWSAIAAGLGALLGAVAGGGHSGRRRRIPARRAPTAIPSGSGGRGGRRFGGGGFGGGGFSGGGGGFGGGGASGSW